MIRSLHDKQNEKYLIRNILVTLANKLDPATQQGPKFNVILIFWYGKKKFS